MRTEEWGHMNAGAECLQLNRNESLENSYPNGNGCQSQQTQAGDSINIPSWILSQYTPALNATDNPYYYENNKLLFALYMERLRRNGEALY